VWIFFAFSFFFEDLKEIKFICLAAFVADCDKECGEGLGAIGANWWGLTEGFRDILFSDTVPKV
jgi:hypothetical protein